MKQAPMHVVLDTNIVLDLWLYKDPATPALQEALTNKTVQWLTTQVMRDELERVLAYTHIVKRLAFSQLTAQDILAQFDAHAQLMPIAPKAQFMCKDGDTKSSSTLRLNTKPNSSAKTKPC